MEDSIMFYKALPCVVGQSLGWGGHVPQCGYYLVVFDVSPCVVDYPPLIRTAFSPSCLQLPIRMKLISRKRRRIHLLTSVFAISWNRPGVKSSHIRSRC